MLARSGICRMIAISAAAFAICLFAENAYAGSTDPSRPLTGKAAQAEEGDRVKILIRHNDLYMLSASSIAECLSGASTPQVIDAISQTNINLSREGMDVSWLPAQGNTGVVFYAQGLDSIYTGDNVYWLSIGGGSVIGAINATGSVPVVTNRVFAQTVTVEDNGLLGLAYFDDPEGDFWLSSTYYLFYYLGTPYNATINLNLLGVATGHQHLAACDVVLAGWDQDHSVRATLKNAGGVVASTTESWSGDDLKTISLSFTGTAWFAEGQNTVQLDTLVDSGYIVEYFDKLTVTYPRYYQAATNRLAFPALSHSDITVSGFTSSNITLLDVTDPWEPVLITTTNVNQGPGGDYRVSFEPEGSNYFAAVTFASPHSVAGVENTHWRDATNQLDYVVVTVEAFLTQADQLADYRADQGLKTGVITVEELYNEFNHGIVNPWAVRNFLSYAMTYWQTAPRYLVLGGSGTLDFKNHNGTAATDPCHVPPVVVNTAFGLFGCDNPMADLDGDNVIDVAIGRLPVRTTAEFDALLAKIVAYESGGTWLDTITLVADDQDSGGDFSTSCDLLDGRVDPGCTVEKLYLDNDSVNDVRFGITNGMNTGTGIMAYMGHASVDGMAEEKILVKDDLASLTNSSRPSVFMAMTCQLGRFALPSAEGGLGEAMVSPTEGGAVAVWAPVSESFNDEGTVMGTNVFDAIFTNQSARLGDAVKEAFEDFYVEAATAKFLLKTFALLGDPGLVVRGPTPVATDYGDAPYPYPTRIADLGAYHVIVDGVHLGSRVDPEEDGIMHVSGEGDDNDGSSDEDGVVFTTPFTPGGSLGVDVTASTTGVLSAWVDFNGDGDWEDASEQIFVDVALVQGVNSLTSSVPAGMTSSNTFARFRFSQSSGLSPTGGISGGEVEDYMVARVPTLAGITSFRAFENDGSVVVQWQTSFEMNSAGFILEREIDGSFARINALIVPAIGGGPYEVTDEGAEPGHNYTYRLVEIEASGSQNTYGPYNVYVRTGFEEWQAEWFTADELGNPAVSGEDADSDGDGHANAEEFAAGTNPLDGTSVLRIVLVRPTGASSFRIAWKSTPGRTYAVERSTSPGGSYIPRATVTATDDRTELTDDVSDGSVLFYRVRLVE